MVQLRPNRTLRCLRVTVSTTATPLEDLVDARLAALSKSMPDMPDGGHVAQALVTPDADVSMKDGDFNDPVTLNAGSAYTFDTDDCLERVSLLCASGTVGCDVILSYV